MSNETISASEQNTHMDALAGGGVMGSLMRALDWSKTPLGKVEDWPQSLKTSVSICLNSRFPVLIWWGPELVKIYNDAYVALIGSKHPSALGRPGREVWPEIWDTIGPLLTGVLERAEASWADDLLLMLERSGYAEECYFTFSYSPIRDESGGVGGVFTPVVETTEKVIAERRLRTLRDLASARNSRTPDTWEACRSLTRGLSDNPHDLPFVATYLFQDDRGLAALAASSSVRGQQFKFPDGIDLNSEQWSVCHRLSAGETCILPVDSFRLPGEPHENRGSLVEQVVAVPICDAYAAACTGFLIAGVNPHKRLDDDYRTFLAQIATEIGEAIREARMLEREVELLSQAETERAKIRDLFQQAPAGILMLQGPKHRVALVNDRYINLVGRKSSRDLAGKFLADALPEIVDQGFIELLDSVYRTGRPFLGNEYKVKLEREESGQAEECYFNFVYQPTRDTAGNIEGILVHAVEVTEQVIARQQIESREEQFRVLADSIPQMAWMANPEGDLFWYNRRWYEYTGTTLEEMKGWGWQALHDPEVLPTVLERFQRSLTTGEPFSMTFPLRGADGNFRNFLTLALPIRDASRKIVRWFGTNTDIEAQRKTEEALRQSEKLAVVGRLASSIAHEINNPLEAVINLVYLAKLTASSEEVTKLLESAEVELGRVAQITSQTLRFHKQQTAPAATDVEELLNSVLTLYRGRLNRDGIHFRLEVEKGRPLVCYAGEVRQVIANLISNALDAMPNGGNLRLRVRSANQWPSGSKSMRITVADTGHGMTRQTMQRLYEPFFTTKQSLGTGLGLWLSSEIVHKHRGTLLVRSSVRPGKTGTVFSLHLPFDALSDKPSLP